MPPRRITLSIVVFWLAMTAWLLWRDIWPSIAPGEPPSFAISRMDDNRSQSVVTWKAQNIPRRGTPVDYTITTTVAHEAKTDLFTLHAKLRPDRPAADQVKLLQSMKLKSEYWVERVPGNMLEARMLGLDVDVEFLAAPINPTGDRHGHFTGQVAGGACDLSWITKGGKPAEHGSESLRVTYHGVVLLPLHPLERIRGLRPGRRWGCPLLDPLESSALFSSGPKVVWVNAEVLGRTETEQGKECLVIEYQGGDISGTTWVDVKEDRVLRMEVWLGSGHWVIKRGT
ncbi:MAG: hypothetical protein HYS12_18675 [Planctomycetes bacterium]|nr:hypothetical protein [Planctomycetota bacterium]